MTSAVDATFEGGQLESKQPIVLAETTPVRVTITPVAEPIDPLESVIGIGEGPGDGADHRDKYIYRKLGNWPWSIRGPGLPWR